MMLLESKMVKTKNVSWISQLHSKLRCENNTIGATEFKMGYTVLNIS